MTKTNKRRIMREFAIDEIAWVDRPMVDNQPVPLVKRAQDGGEPISKKLPTRSPGESKADFVGRFMADPKMRSEYPDAAQRRAIAEKQFGKRIALTTVAMDHAHTLITDRDSTEMRIGSTSWVQGHQHDWVMDDNGNITLATVEGHTHDVALMIGPAALKSADMDTTLDALEVRHAGMPYWKRAFSAKEREKLAQSGAALPDGSFPISNKADLMNALRAFGRASDKAKVARHIKARAKALGLSDLLPSEGTLAALLSKGMDSVGNPDAASGGKENTSMTDEEKQAAIKAAEKRAERAESIVALSSQERAHFDTLKGEEQDAFLTKSEAERASVLKAAQDADPVIHTTRNGTQFRKSDDPRLVEQAKQLDAQEEELAKNRALTKRAEFEKQAASDLSHLPGTVDVKIDLLTALETIPQEKREPVLAMLKAQDAGVNAAMQRYGTSAGDTTPAEGADEAEQQLDSMAKALAAKDSIPLETAWDRVLQTPEGRALYAKHLGH